MGRPFNTQAKVMQRFSVSENGCWEWLGGLNHKGYGRLTYNYKGYAAHRFVYELLVGAIPEGLTLDHLCRNKRCVNPAHLEPVTIGVNVMRGEGLAKQNATKTHCIHGHSLANAKIGLAHGKPTRICQICRRASYSTYRARRRVQVARDHSSGDAT
jgi:hypothetical protein